MESAEHNVRIAAAQTDEEMLVVRSLFEEYRSSFGFTPCFQNFASEVAGLPGEYGPPGGGLGLARVNGEPAGCVAFRRIDAARCEAKRLYVSPAFRGCGIGRALLEWLVSEARTAGYSEILGDMSLYP